MGNELIREKKPNRPPLRKPRRSGHPEIQPQLKGWATREALRKAYFGFPVTALQKEINQPADADALAIVKDHQNLTNAYLGGVTPPQPNRGINPPTTFTNNIS